MTRPNLESPTPKTDTLWMLTIAPAIWAAHLMLSYITAAVWCAKFAGADGSLGGVRTAIGWYTTVALTGIAFMGWEGFRRHSHGTETTTHDLDASIHGSRLARSQPSQRPLGLILVASGIVPIKASSGHWRITAAILDFAKVRSVTTHSMGIRPPFPLDDPALVLRGAGHYEGCYPCHGRPGVPVRAAMAAMTPPPPELSPLIRRWRPQDLFSIVKHGIKFTGMPAWPAQQRDDEVWAMVAFLRRMPELDAAAYRQLVYGPTDAMHTAMPRRADLELQDEQQAPRIVQEICSRCHGLDGTGRGPGAFPSLAGQRSAYLLGSLRAFAERRRFSGIMGTIAANLDDQTMREATSYYERLPARLGGAANVVNARARGELIATHGVPDRDIPSCAHCHGPGEAPKNQAYPMLAGQHARYLAQQLELFQRRQRGGSGLANLMHVFVGRLRPEQIADVALYYSSWRDEGRRFR